MFFFPKPKTNVQNRHNQSSRTKERERERTREKPNAAGPGCEWLLCLSLRWSTSSRGCGDLVCARNKTSDNQNGTQHRHKFMNNDYNMEINKWKKNYQQVEAGAEWHFAGRSQSAHVDLLHLFWSLFLQVQSINLCARCGLESWLLWHLLQWCRRS